MRQVARSEKPVGTSWTVGTGYSFSPSANIFARYTSAFSYPRLDNILGGATLPGTTDPLPTADVQLAEGCFKYAMPGLRIAATAFWSKFKNLNGGTQIADANGLIANSNIIFDTRTYSVEFEAVASPFAGFDIMANGMVQKPTNTRVPPRFQLTVEPSYAFDIGGFEICFIRGAGVERISNP